MKQVGLFGIERPGMYEGDPSARRDAPYLRRIQEFLGGGWNLKHSLTRDGEAYLSMFASKVRKADLDAVIITDAVLLEKVLEALPDYKPSFDKRGQKKSPTLNDYHGSFFSLPASRTGHRTDLDVLVLNPLEHLRTVPEGAFIFKRFVGKLSRESEWFPQSNFVWELANQSTIQALFDNFRAAKLIAVDIETYEDDPLRRISCIGYCGLFPDGTTHSVVLPLNELWALPWLRKFNDLPTPKVLQGGMYDTVYLMRYAAPLRNYLHDTYHLFHSWYSELPKRLDFITAFSLRKMRFWKNDGKTGGVMGHYEYNARDSWATLNSYCSLLLEVPQWARDNYLQEFPLIFPCITCELDGMATDKARFDANKKALEEKLAPLEQSLERMIGVGFNPASPVQVKTLLKVLGVKDRRGKDVTSSDEKTLVAAAAAHPINERIISLILEVRGYRKLLSTYFVWDKIWNGRLHYRLDPGKTDTARLACTESSYWCGLQIQNIPSRDGPIVKDWLCADEGWLLAEGDKAQSEARCVGYLSGCKSLIELVEGPHDYHSWNASAFFGVAYDSIYDESKRKTLNKKLRDLSKRTNHGANYNMGAGVMLETMGPKMVAEAKRILGLQPRLTLIEVCQYLLNRYADTYPEVKRDWYEWIKRTISLTKKLVSPFGWTRYFFSDVQASKPAFNSAVAHGPQNLSVGVVNREFYLVWRESIYGSLRGLVRVKAQIHDSILFAYKGSDTPARVQALMSVSVPVTDIKGITRTMLIPTDMSTGPEGGTRYWSELK